ncbi:MAG TPA: hypothetical protein VFE27_04940 [Acidobacteriaceae bacterium]|nr:hypothetical protein [Acidobacteriaceae bacterium]
MIRASPGLQSGEAGFQTRENALSCHYRAFSPGENAPSSPFNPIRIINPEFKDLAQTWGWKMITAHEKMYP